MGKAKDKIFIKDLLVRGIIGVNDWERENPQDILINIVISADLEAAGQNDDIRQSVDYRTISKKIIGHVSKAQPLTAEALAADIAGLCLEEERVEKVKVRVEKPGAVRFSQSAGVEIERSRKE
jgi:FolB domain-containing protein